MQPEFPDAYWSALEQLSAGRHVPLPRPHPKFTVEDMARIAQEGPRFRDFVLEHAQALRDPAEEQGDDDDQQITPGPTSAIAYNYVPASVLGDWQYDVEPNWRQIEQMPLLEFFQVYFEVVDFVLDKYHK